MNYRPNEFDATPLAAAPLQSPMEIMLDVWELVVRYKSLIIKFVVAFLVLAVVYLLLMPKQYVSTAEMIIDPRKSEEFATRRGSDAPTAQVDTAVVDSEGAVLTSESVALSVIKKLGLVDDPTFKGPPSLIASFGSLLDRVLGSTPPTDYKKLRWAVEDFERRLSVKRIGVTYVFDISFKSTSPEQAAQIANAVAAAYVDDTLQAKYTVRLRAATWMQDRLKALGEQATEAERAVADFKRKNAIVDAGGRLLDEQQVSELQSQLSLARAAKSNAKAKLDRINQVLVSGKLDMSVTDALSNQVIIKLRDTYTDLSKREADLESRLGATHEAPSLLRKDMEHVRSSIFDELKRIGEGYKSDFQIASSQEEGLTTALQQAVSDSAVTSQAQVELNRLKSSSDAYRALYDTFLQRLGEAVQQQSFPLTETRVVTSATPPLKKSEPKTIITLLGAIVAGSLCGFGVGWVRDKTDKTLRDGVKAEKVAETVHITSVPLIRGGGDGVVREVLDRPLSAFTESIRELRVVTELHRTEHNVQVLGFASALPGEGKSTVAVSLATLTAKAKLKVLMIDCDIRNPSLSHLVQPSSIGLAELLLGSAAPDQAIQRDQLGGFDVLPISTSRAHDDPGYLISSSEMKSLIEVLKTRYDLIIVDLPPLLSVIDTKAAAMLFDGFVIVAEWGKTPAATIGEALRMSGRVKDRLIGIVLNKVDPRLVGRYRGNYVSASI